MSTRTILLTAVLSLGLTAASAATTLVSDNSEWKWLHPTDGVDPAERIEDFHTSFYKMEFDDSQWKTGTDKPGTKGGFGYGNEWFEGDDIGAPLDPENRKTAYFRLKFKTEREHDGLVFQCQRDDGIIVYLDGKEVLRDNVPAGDDAYDLFADEIVGGNGEEEEWAAVSFPLKVKLPPGQHILAISLHNRAEGSSDLRIAAISLSVQSDAPADSRED